MSGAVCTILMMEVNINIKSSVWRKPWPERSTERQTVSPAVTNANITTVSKVKMMRLMLNDDPGVDPDEDDHHDICKTMFKNVNHSLPASPFIRRPSKSNSFHSHVRLPGEW